MSIFISTILIPTYNRPHSLHRLLNYILENFNLEKIKIIVLDGSDNHSSESKKICSQSDIDYRYYGPDIPILERWLDGIKSAETEFISFLADDDILQPKGYYESLEFLQSNTDYAAAHGNYVWFLDQKDQTILYPGYQSFSIEHDFPLERLFYFLLDYSPITYAVYRTELLKTAYQETVDSIVLDNFHFTELLSGCIPVLLGKVKKLDTNYYGKNLGDSSPSPLIIYPKVVFTENFSYQYRSIKNSLKKYLYKIDPHIADDAIDYSFGAYYGKVLDGNLVSQYFNRLLNSFKDSGNQ